MADLGGWDKVEESSTGPRDSGPRSRRPAIQARGVIVMTAAVGDPTIGRFDLPLRGRPCPISASWWCCRWRRSREAARSGARPSGGPQRSLRLACPEADVRSPRFLMVVDQRDDGHGHRLGPGPVRLPRKRLVNALIDLPFAVPTVVTGVMLVVLYGPSSVDRNDPGPLRLGRLLPSAGHRPGVPARYLSVRDSERPAGLLELDRAEEEAASRWAPAPGRSFDASRFPPSGHRS